MRRYILLATLLLCSAAFGQSINPTNYIYPIKGVAGYLSANFGELRPDHFHSGVDIKSDGEIGKHVMAANDGYISRISLSPWGFGLALYIAHPDGATTTYAHLWRLREDMAKYLTDQRYKQQKHSINLYLSPDDFPVKRGEVIAYSGNSGSSFGPHLHYEIRDAKQRPLNPIALGVVSAKDDIAPSIEAIYYVELDSVAGVSYRAPYKKYETVRGADNSYTLKGDAKAWVGRRGYFVAQLRDRKCQTSNSYGIYKIDLKCDGKPIFGYQLDSFSFDKSRYCNAISDYALSQQISGEVFRLAQLGRGSSDYYHTMVNRGVVGAEAGEERRIELSVADDEGNTSSLSFTMRGVAPSDRFKAQVDPKVRIIRAEAEFKHIAEGLRLTIPAYSLYEATPLFDTITSPSLTLPEGVEQLTRCYSIMSDSIPIHKSFKIEIYHNAPDSLSRGVMMAKVAKNGTVTPAAGRLKGSYIESESRRFGTFVGVRDCVAPNISINSISKGVVNFTITDNFAGVADYAAHCDGKWLAVDLDKNRYSIKLPMPATGAERTLRLWTKDGAGNVSEVVHEFVW